MPLITGKEEQNFQETAISRCRISEVHRELRTFCGVRNLRNTQRLMGLSEKKRGLFKNLKYDETIYLENES